MREKLTRRWQTCSRRDRLIFVCLGLVMLVLLLWFSVISPLGKRINYLEKRIPELESRLNAMRSQSLAEVRVAGAGSASAADLRSTLLRALGERKISAELRALSSSRVEMRLPELPMNEALDLLESLRRESGARIVVVTANTASGTAARLVLEFERSP